MLYVERLERMAQRALLASPPYGVIEGHRRVKLVLVMDCEQPYTAQLHSRVSARHGKRVQPFTVNIEARCRKCLSCKRRRSMFWAAKAMTEFQKADRTYMGTFTMSPAEHSRLDDLITLRLAEGRVDFNVLSDREIFEERVKEFGAEVTKWLKRVRKYLALGPGALRYLLIAEVHDSENTGEEMRGRPHFHILLHERDAGSLIEGDPLAIMADHTEAASSGELVGAWRKLRNGSWVRVARAAPNAVVKREWSFGLTDFQWAESGNQAVYVCKYLSKSLMLRVRASQHYGAEDEGLQGPSAPNTPIGKAVVPTTSVPLDLRNRTDVRAERETGTSRLPEARS